MGRVRPFLVRLPKIFPVGVGQLWGIETIWGPKKNIDDAQSSDGWPKTSKATSHTQKGLSHSNSDELTCMVPVREVSLP